VRGWAPDHLQQQEQRQKISQAGIWELLTDCLGTEGVLWGEVCRRHRQRSHLGSPLGSSRSLGRGAGRALPARAAGAAAPAGTAEADGAREGMVGKGGVGWGRVAAEVAAATAAGSVLGAAVVPAHSLRSGGPKKRKGSSVCVCV
jgi:hypothetical protein